MVNGGEATVRSTTWRGRTMGLNTTLGKAQTRCVSTSPTWCKRLRRNCTTTTYDKMSERQRHNDGERNPSGEEEEDDVLHESALNDIMTLDITTSTSRHSTLRHFFQHSFFFYFFFFEYGENDMTCSLLAPIPDSTFDISTYDITVQRWGGLLHAMRAYHPPGDYNNLNYTLYP